MTNTKDITLEFLNPEIAKIFRELWVTETHHDCRAVGRFVVMTVPKQSTLGACFELAAKFADLMARRLQGEPEWPRELEVRQ